MFLKIITKRVDKGSSMDIIYLDYQRDKTPHRNNCLS